MEYSKLNLAQASLVKKEVDLTLQKLNELISLQPSQSDDPAINNSLQQLNYQNYKQKLLHSIQHRIDELEQFYLMNSDDERAVLFEKERLRLRKVLQNYVNQPTTNIQQIPSSPRDGNSVNKTIDTRSIHSSTTGRGFSNQQQQPPSSFDQREIDNQQQLQQQFQQMKTSPNLSINANSLNVTKSNTSVPNASTQLLSTRKSPVSPQPIYAWEERSEKPSRNTLTVDDVVYEPTSRAGFYKRIGTTNTSPGSPGEGDEDPFEGGGGVNLEDDDDEQNNRNNDRFIDFQIVLTHDEITALAARRKKERDDIKLVKSKAAATSVHSATPYIDPRRIKLDMLRPGHPDRWLHPEGMK